MIIKRNNDNDNNILFSNKLIKEKQPTNKQLKLNRAVTINKTNSCKNHLPVFTYCRCTILRLIK